MTTPAVAPSSTTCSSAPASSPPPWLQPHHQNPPPSDPWFLRSSDRDAQLLTNALASQLRSRTPALDPLTASSMSSHAAWPADSHAVLRAWQQRNAALSQLQPHSGSSLSSPDLPGSPFQVNGSDNNNSITSAQSHLSVEPESNKMGSLHSSFSGALGTVTQEESGSPTGAKGVLSSLSSSLRVGALSVQAAVGAVSTKVSKRRSRAINKPPITVLSADTSNFRDMVQKLTGIPTSPSLQRNRYQLWSTPSGVSVLKPHPTRPSQSIHNLPTLDTSSAFFLLDGDPSLSQASRLLQDENFLQSSLTLPFVQSSRPLNNALFPDNFASELAMNRVASQLQQAAFASGAPIDLKSLFTNHLNDLSRQGDPTDQNNSTPVYWDPSHSSESDRTRERLFVERLQERLGAVSNPIDGTSNVTQAMAELEHFNRRSTTSLESMLMGNDRLDLDFPGKTLHTVDSWLSCDGIHAQPKMELAHSA